MRYAYLRGTALAGILSAFVMAPAAHATQGYFQPGYDAIQQALASAGSANPESAMTIADDPAGLVGLGGNFEAGFSLFAPYRDYKAANTSFVARGTVNSGWDLFAMPNLAYSAPIDAGSAWGIAMYGNGGMNTLYPPVANTAPYAQGCPGVYCGGKAGVNLGQFFISPAYARKFGNVSLGIAPVLAIQYFDAEGLAAFANPQITTNPKDFTNNGMSYSYGGGLRLGAQWNAAPGLRFDVDGATTMLMTKFSKYSGLFASGGSFDIPATIAAGVAWDAMPNLTLMATYRHIFYSDVASVADSSNSYLTGTKFGSSGGPGFGWKDVDVAAIAAEWRATQALTLRAGYAHNTNPVPAEDVTINILAPGVVTDEISGGGTYLLGAHTAVDASLLYVPTASVSGSEIVPAPATPGSNIRLSMHQWDLTLDYRYMF